MSKLSDYGDSQDKADYQVVRSNSRSGKSTSRFINSERLLVLTIIFILLFTVLLQASATNELSKKTTVESFKNL